MGTHTACRVYNKHHVYFRAIVVFFIVVGAFNLRHKSPFISAVNKPLAVVLRANGNVVNRILAAIEFLLNYGAVFVRV